MMRPERLDELSFLALEAQLAENYGKQGGQEGKKSSRDKGRRGVLPSPAGPLGSAGLKTGGTRKKNKTKGGAGSSLPRPAL